MSKKEKQMNKHGVQLIVERNLFYLDSYKNAFLAMMLLLILNIALAIGVVYLWVTPPQPQYFPTTSDGRIINMHPLTDPVVTDNFVLQWTTNAIYQAFSLDYMHWRDQLQKASDYFTPSGWHGFINSLKTSNNLKSLVDLKLVSNATVTGTPEILKEEVVDNHYAWKVKVPLLVTYNSSNQPTISIPFNVIVIVLRMPVKDNPDRIGINNFLADEPNVSAYQNNG